MNKQWIAQHVEEARDQLTGILNDLIKDDDYSAADFMVAMAHAYHHLNTAWNTRNYADEQVADQSMDDYYEWERFPAEKELMLGSDGSDL